MQDIKRIQAEPELFKTLVAQKNLDINIDNLIELSQKRQSLSLKIEEQRQKRNENVEAIKAVNGKPPVDLLEIGKSLKEEIQNLEAEFQQIDAEYRKIIWKTPQTVSADTPIGKDETGNVEVRRWAPQGGIGSDPAKIGFDQKDHIELGTSLNILDLDRGVKTGGFRAYYLKNAGALMHMGLMMHGLKFIQSKGFQTFVPPTIVKPDSLWGSGHFPFDEANIYVVDSLKNADEVEKERKYLIGTAEPSILNYRAGETIDKSELPLKYAGFSQCYRSEIGSHGRDTKGIYRIHEFMKIEQVVICDGDYETSEKMHQEMLAYSEELLQSLKLPYRVIQLCTGDMGAGKYKMFDIETWMPSRGAYGETHSASNLGDWQPRRLNIKVKDENGNKYYPHALNNTVVASPRILIAIWENYQNPDGTITVPEVLREYVGTDVIKPM